MKNAGMLVLTWLVAGCGGGGADSDLEALVGIYQTTKHTLNQEGCGTEGAEETDPSYFQFVLEDLLGTSYLAFGSCESADPESCTSNGIFDAWLKQGGEIQHEVQMASGGGEYGPCNLTLTLGSLDSDTDSVSLQIRTYQEQDDTLDEEQCDTDEAKARGTDMPCVSFEVIEGSRIR